jgi:enoyl-CoA hydratase/carnithine racemase
MDPTTLSLTLDGRIVRITLQRPERLNAINREMPRQLAAAVGDANAAPGVHVIVVAGAGRAFCAGYDLEWGTRVEAEARVRGVKAALATRDGPFADYGSRPKPSRG